MADERSSRFGGYDSDLWGDGELVVGAEPASLVGTTVGHIRLEALLGSGGMGDVYRGFDERLQRVVAVKTIRADHRLSGTARSRFLREARILSKLAHPSICQVYDLVEAEQADLLILEFVDGETLQELARRGELDQRRVLELAAKIAEALVVAHREQIVHRDLKPANIMVLPSGDVKVLDFGIARSTAGDALAARAAGVREGSGALRIARPDGPGSGSGAAAAPPPAAVAQDGDSTRVMANDGSTAFSADLTQQGAIVGTVRYMSPEQAEGVELTEASDLFSFGIVLQELLTGKSAYPTDESVPQTLLRVYNNDSLPIEGVDPDVARLVEDLKHPTPARRPSAAQALERIRFILDKPQRLRRRRLQVRAIAAAFVLLVAVLAVVTVLAVREKRARGRAEELALQLEREAERANREATTANRVVEFLTELFDEANPESSRGREITVREAVDRGAARILTELEQEPRIQARLQETMGTITWSLGELARAATLLEQAQKTLEQQAEVDETALAKTLRRLGAVYVDLERFDEAAVILDRARSLFERAGDTGREGLGATHNSLGALAFARGELDRAEAEWSSAIELFRRSEPAPLRELALALNNSALVAWRRADFSAAEGRLRDSLAANEELLGANHPHLAAQLNNLGILSRDQGKLDEAERLHRRALAIAETALGPTHPDVASILSSLARLHVRQNRSSEGIALLERSLAICRAAYGDEHAETGTTLVRLGDLERRAGRTGRAERLVNQGLATLRAALGEEHPRLVEAWRARADVERAFGRSARAAAALAAAVRIGRATLGGDHPDVRAAEQELAAVAPLTETPPHGGPP